MGTLRPPCTAGGRVGVPPWVPAQDPGPRPAPALASPHLLEVSEEVRRVGVWAGSTYAGGRSRTRSVNHPGLRDGRVQQHNDAGRQMEPGPGKTPPTNDRPPEPGRFAVYQKHRGPFGGGPPINRGLGRAEHGPAVDGLPGVPGSTPYPSRQMYGAGADRGLRDGPVRPNS